MGVGDTVHARESSSDHPPDTLVWMVPEPGMLPTSGRRQATVALMLATAMQAFDATIANVALPQLEQNLGAGIDFGSWVMTSYLCASAVMAMMTGWLRRRWGARPVFTIAIALFVAASLLCALAQSSDALVFFRLIQGAAAGILQPLSQAMVLDLYPQARTWPHAGDMGGDHHGRPDAGPGAGRRYNRSRLLAMDLRGQRPDRHDRLVGIAFGPLVRGAER